MINNDQLSDGSMECPSCKACYGISVLHIHPNAEADNQREEAKVEAKKLAPSSPEDMPEWIVSAIANIRSRPVEEYSYRAMITWLTSDRERLIHERDEAVKAEREACAKIAINCVDSETAIQFALADTSNAEDVGYVIAAAIRDRSRTSKEGK